MDDRVEPTRNIQVIGDIPVDMSMSKDAPGIGENLEAEDDDDDLPKMEIDEPKGAQVMDEDEDDPLDAFMTSVVQEVSKVNAEDRKKTAKNRQTRPMDDDLEVDDENEYQMPVDELDTTDLNPEDILALAAKKAKKKDIPVVDHTKIAYEPFRRAFYHPPPDIADMTEEEAELLRLELDGIKIRGVDCPKPVTKWSHFGMPSSWYADIPEFTPLLTLFVYFNQSGCYQTSELCSPDCYSISGNSCHHVRARRYRSGKDRFRQDNCVSTSYVSTHKRSKTVGTNGRSYCYGDDPDKRISGSNSSRMQTLSESS